MSNGYTQAHLEWLAKWAYSNTVARPDQYHVILYDDEADDIGFVDDVEDVESEPDGYDRATLAFPADTHISVGEQFIDIEATTATFDFEGVSGEVDTAGVIWEAELDGDSEPTEHLMVRTALDDRVELGDVRGEYPVEVRWQLHPFF